MDKIRSIVTALIILMVIMPEAYAIPARRRPYTVTQPDGSTITIQQHGDEFHHWITDLQGTRLTRDSAGYYHPATDVQTFAQRAASATERRAEISTRRRAAASATDLARGTNHFLVVLVQFADLKFTVDEPQKAFTALLNEPGYAANGGTGSARDYYSDNSHGRFTPIFDVVGPVTVSGGYADYGANDRNDEDTHATLAFAHACAALDADMDFSKYDLDKDGYVDNVFFYYAGYNEAEDGPANSIWPHQWDFDTAASVDRQLRNYTFDGVKLGSYACTSELKGNSGRNMCGIGTFCHEFGHVIGLPDFYDIDYEDNGEGMGLLNFSLMDAGSYNNDGRTPPYLTAIERDMLGWMSLEQWTSSGEKVIQGVQNDVGYWTPTSVDGEYFVYECRNGEGWDAHLIDDYEGHDIVSKGLLIYHVDKSNNRVGYYTAKTLWEEGAVNMYGSHQCCDLIKAKNRINWYEEVMFGDITGVRNYNGTSSPAAKEWSGKLTGHNLYDIRMEGDHIVLTYKWERTDVLYSGDITAIANPGKGTYAAGSAFSLDLLVGKTEPASVKWMLDGAEVSGKSVILNAGDHVIMAELTMPDGSVTVLEQEVTAR